MKNLLAIETSGQYLGLGLFDVSGNALKSLAVYYEPTPLKQSDLLFPTLSRLLKKAKRKKADIDGIAVNVGPGSFTGVRVGVSAARALAQGLAIPLIGVSGLECMAMQHGESRKAVVALIPALDKEFYMAAYSRNNDRLKKIAAPAWLSEEKVATLLTSLGRRMRDVAVVITDESKRGSLAELSNMHWIVDDAVARPETLAQLAMDRFQRESIGKFHYERTVPMYLQPSWAERQRALKS